MSITAIGGREGSRPMHLLQVALLFDCLGGVVEVDILEKIEFLFEAKVR
jgi:hypothetical protein